MQGIWQPAPFAGFGWSQWTLARPILATEVVLPSDDRQTRRLIRDRCAAAPGVYGMIDAQGELIYVGKSRSLRDRLVSYFYDAAANEKGRTIAARAERLVWEPAAHEFAALVRELELIRRWRPRFNVQGQPGRRRRKYLCLSDGPAPHVTLATLPTAGARACFGPISGGRQGQGGVNRLNLFFKLRDCSQDTKFAFADQRELFPLSRVAGCLRRELGSCLAPCAAGCTTLEYDRQVGAVLDFLRGQGVPLLAKLDREMQAAARARRFEQAALLRDVWADLRWVHNQLERLRQLRARFSFVYPLPGHGRQRSWYLIRAGQLAGVIAAPRDARSARRCLARLAEVYPSAGDAAPKQSQEDFDVLWLISRWFREHPAELDATLMPERAAERCEGLLQSR